MSKNILRLVISILGPLLSIALTTFLVKISFSPLYVQNVALIFLIPVMVSTALWGLFPGLLAGFVSFLTFNYFFISPYNTLLVHHNQDIITLVMFLVVAVVFSQLIGQARKSVLLAREREWEATRMYELISALAGLASVQQLAETFAESLVLSFRFECAEVMTRSDGGKNISAVYPRTGRPARQAELSYPLKTWRSEEGEVHIWHSGRRLKAEEQRLLGAFCAQSALAIERIRLSEGEKKLQVLEESDQLKTSLLNSVSHELRSPLAAIKASISSLRSGAIKWNHSARMELLATVEEETDQLNLLVGNLLDMSRIESGSLKPHLHWNSIPEIAQGVGLRMKKLLQGHNLEFDFPADLPLIPSDYVLLEQVFTNLISNSVKYAPTRTKVAISAQVEGGLVRVMVMNQSPRVDEENLQHIFEKFFRAAQDDKVIGTGLGLSICKGIIEAHGGNIWAENAADGFLFIFTLPITLNGMLPEVPKEEMDG